MSHVFKILLIASAALLGLFLAESLLAAGEPVEIRLRAESTTAGSIVRLGDLADVVCDKAKLADKWRALTLFPAPAAGRTQAIASREIQDVVALHYGADASIRWTGAAETRLTAVSNGTNLPAPAGGEIALVSEPAPAPKSIAAPASPASVISQLTKACEAFLETQSGRKGWQVRPRASSRDLAAIHAAGSDWRITSIDNLTSGSRRFTIAAGKNPPLNIIADVAAVSVVVVAKRDLPRGTLLSAEQLSLEPVAARTSDANFAVKLEEVVGQELQQLVPAGQPIDTRQIRRQLMVRRGGPVLVIAWASGVKVKTNGRVLGDGAHGDLVEVQAIDSNDRFMARVVEPRTVEVFAGVLSVPADGSAGDAAKAASPSPVKRLSTSSIDAQ